jgi:hypothetical protein
MSESQLRPYHVIVYVREETAKPQHFSWSRSWGRGQQLDLYNVKHVSLELDMTILFRTLGRLLYSEV